MTKRLTRITAVALLMLMSLVTITSCSGDRRRNKTADQEVIEVTDKFCQAILDYDVDVIADIAQDDFEDETCSKILKYYYRPLDSATKQLSDAILAGLTYRIDKNTVLASYEKEEGTIDVVFSYPDYAMCHEENPTLSKTQLAGILSDYSTTYKIVTIDYAYDDAEWLVIDFEKVFIDLFSWKEYDFDQAYDFKGHLESFEVSDYIGRTGTSTDYVNLEAIQFGVTPTNFLGEWESCTCSLYYETTLLCSYNLIDDYDYYYTNIWATYCGFEYFPSGSYEVVLTDFLGNEIDRFSYTVALNEDDVTFTMGGADLVDGIKDVYWDKEYDGSEFKLCIEVNKMIVGYECYYTITDADGEVYVTAPMKEYGTDNKCFKISGKVDSSDLPDGRVYLCLYDSNDDLIVKAIMTE